MVARDVQLLSLSPASRQAGNSLCWKHFLEKNDAFLRQVKSQTAVRRVNLHCSGSRRIFAGSARSARTKENLKYECDDKLQNICFFSIRAACLIRRTCPYLAADSVSEDPCDSVTYSEAVSHSPRLSKRHAVYKQKAIFLLSLLPTQLYSFVRKTLQFSSLNFNVQRINLNHSCQ